MDYMKNKRKIIKFFLNPVFERNNYEIKKSTSEWTLFVNKGNTGISIDFDFMPMVKNILETRIKHPKLDKELFFPCVMNGPEKVIWNAGMWMGYTTIDELLGLIEFQANNFQEWIFDFLSEEKYAEIFENVNRQRKNEIEYYSKLNQEERFKLDEKSRIESEIISSKRYAPINWTIELYEKRKMNSI